MKRESSPSECWARTGAMCNASNASIERVVSRANVRSCRNSAMISSRAVSARVKGICRLDFIRGEQ
jgi:hypothetical protein